MLAMLPPWARRLANGQRKFWEFTPEEIERRLEGRQITQETGNAAAELRQKERDGLRAMMGEHFTPRNAPMEEGLEMGHTLPTSASRSASSKDL